MPLYFVFYNFCRIHKTLNVTPAMAAGITSKLMGFEDIVALVDAAAPKVGRPKTHKKRAITQPWLGTLETLDFAD